MMQVLGFAKSDFTAKDKTQVTGMNLYVVYERNKVTGHACERIYVTDAKLNGYAPAVGDNINVTYNRFGKVDTVTKAKQ